MAERSFQDARADDRACIGALVNRYAHNGREGVDIADMLPLFTDDAVAILPNGVQVPIQHLSDVLQGEEAKYIRHHLTTVDIRWTGPASADGESQFFAITNEASPDHWGCWRDKFEKQGDGSWKISQRAIVVDGGHPDGWFIRMYGSTEA
jgi:ketosteroid isomerase-like protein